MTRTCSLRTMMLLFAMMMLAGIAALIWLGSASAALPTAGATIHQAASIEWLRPDQVHVPGGLTISVHAAKHNGDTEKIYRMLLQGKCAEAAKYCGGSEIEFAYFCIDPVTGVVGAILQFGDEIMTGYYEKSGSGHWARRVPRERWRACR